MAYELGAGLGVAIFGLMLSWFYSRSIILPEQLPTSLIEKRVFRLVKPCN